MFTDFFPTLFPFLFSDFLCQGSWSACPADRLCPAKQTTTLDESMALLICQPNAVASKCLQSQDGDLAVRRRMLVSTEGVVDLPRSSEILADVNMQSHQTICLCFISN